MQTPYYQYNLNRLEQTLCAVEKYSSLIPNAHVHYAIKANANPLLLSTIVKHNMGVDCVSGGEIQAAINAGFAPSSIVFAGVGKADWEIDLALDHEISCFNVESEAELEIIQERAALKGSTAHVALRVNPNVDAHTHVNITTGLAENKFGIEIPMLEAIINRCNSMKNICFCGLHFHIGSQILDAEPFTTLCHKINELQSSLKQKGIKVKSINVGGGLGIDYINPEENPIPNFEQYFRIFKENLKLEEEQHLHFELGRAIVAQCGRLITKVLYVKQGTTKQFAIVDAGMTDLIRPALYDAYHKIINISSQSTEVETYDVVGPICESSDVFAKDITLPQTKRGDLIAILSAGAYGEVMASMYNCRKMPGSIAE